MVRTQVVSVTLNFSVSSPLMSNTICTSNTHAEILSA